MKALSRRSMDKLMRFLIDYAYASVPGDEKILHTRSPQLTDTLKALGLADRKDQALHVLAGYELIQLEESRKSGQTHIILTNKGKAYFEQKRDARIALWGRSIVLPILISLITTMIAVYILPPVGTQVGKWLQSFLPQTSQSQTRPAPSGGLSDNQPTIPEASIEARP